MPSETDVANVALRLVGGTRITSFTQATPNANAINDIYSEIRDTLLEYPWNFATQRVELAKLTATPSFKFDTLMPSLPIGFILYPFIITMVGLEQSITEKNS